MTTEWIAAQLIKPTRPQAVRRRPPVNPHAPGQFWPGSTAEAVLNFMCRPAHLGRFFTHAELILATQRSSKAVCWAVSFLVSTGRIEASHSDPRNPRYRRYRVPRHKVIED